MPLIQDAPRASTTGRMGFFNGTKDNQEAYIDYGTGASNVNSAKEVNVTLENIRAMDHKPSHAQVGYEMRHEPTALSAEELLAGNSPEGKAKINDAYFAECIKIVRKVVGPEVPIIPSYFKVRQGKKSEKGVNDVENDKYAVRPFVHVDRDPNTIIAPVRDAVGPEETYKLMRNYKRWAQVNVWRPIGNPATKNPLAFIHHQHMPEWHYDTHFGRIYARNDPRNGMRGEKVYDSIASYDPKYRYYYASDMTPEEVWVFNSFDSEKKTAAPHGAFWDDNTPEDAPERASIEVRLVVFFDEREDRQY